MKKYRFSRILLLFAVIFITIDQMYKPSISKDIVHFKNEKDHPWDVTPKIVNCNPKIIPDDHFKNALEFWKGKGESFVLVENYEEYEYHCREKIRIEGFILVGTRRNFLLLNDALGSTWKDTKRMVTLSKGRHRVTIAAFVVLDRDVAEDETLLIHEIGHAVGYKHTNGKGNIMHRYHDYSGLEFYK